MAAETAVQPDPLSQRIVLTQVRRRGRTLGVTRAEFMQMMGMMAQIVQALVPPVRTVPVAGSTASP